MIKILQFNANGLKNKFNELSNWLNNEDIKIAAIQETKFNTKSKIPTIPNYTLIFENRANNGGGVAFLIHKSLNFQRLPEIKDPHIEHIGIKVDNLTIINLYIPPTTSCSTPNYSASLARYLQNEDTLIVGDFNAHDPLWHSTLTDPRGNDFADEIGDLDFGVLNENVPTRIPTNQDQQPTSPDVSLASLSLLPYSSWETHTTFSSDHLPIVITLDTEIKIQNSEKRTFTNFKKADWEKFKEITETEFESMPLPVDVYKGEKIFRKIINKAAKICIPSGRIKEIIPEIPTSTARKIKERDLLRSTQPNSPHITQLNNEIFSEINTHKREKWKETIANINRKTDSSKLFKLIKNLNGSNTKSNCNQSIKFKGKYISYPTKIANAFNKQYTSIVEHKSSRESRCITNRIKSIKIEEAIIFTIDQTKSAIKMSKSSKALGPDNISPLHLKHIGPAAINYLTTIFNLSIKHSQIPSIWKSSVIIPLLKPNKPAEEAGSYRPVSLLCPAIKILERRPSYQHYMINMGSENKTQL